jgi:hypothetical protein
MDIGCKLVTNKISLFEKNIGLTVSLPPILLQSGHAVSLKDYLMYYIIHSQISALCVIARVLVPRNEIEQCVVIKM